MRFAVCFVPEDHYPKIEIIEAADWRDAAFSHTLQPWDMLDEHEHDSDDDNEFTEIGNAVPQSYSDAQDDAEDRGVLFAYVAIP